MHLTVADSCTRNSRVRQREPTIIDPPSAGTESAGRCIICRLACWIRSWLIVYVRMYNVWHACRQSSTCVHLQCVGARSPGVIKVVVEYAEIEITAHEMTNTADCDRCKQSVINRSMRVYVCAFYVFAHMCPIFSRAKKKKKSYGIGYECFVRGFRTRVTEINFSRRA